VLVKYKAQGNNLIFLYIVLLADYNQPMKNLPLFMGLGQHLVLNNLKPIQGQFK